MSSMAAASRGVSHPAPVTATPRVHHGRISSRRYWLLRNRYLRVRHELKHVRREVKRETIKLERALMPRGKVGHLSASAAPCKDNKYGETADGEYHMCECCFAPIKINKYGETVGDETCKECQRLLCSNCCFASEKAPSWFCRMCVVTKRLLPIWRPTTEGRHDRVLSVSIQVRRRGRVYGEAMLA